MLRLGKEYAYTKIHQSVDPKVTVTKSRCVWQIDGNKLQRDVSIMEEKELSFDNVLLIAFINFFNQQFKFINSLLP